MITKYKIIVHTDSDSTASEVNRHLADGYVLHGKLKIIQNIYSGSILYIQVMVKE